MMRFNKYGAKALIVEGYRFASQAEARRYGELQLLERAGEIDGLNLQPHFPLIVKGTKVGYYIGDFEYFDKRGHLVIEDVKSPATRTSLYRLKKKLVKAIYGIEIAEVEA